MQNRLESQNVDIQVIRKYLDHIRKGSYKLLKWYCFDFCTSACHDLHYYTILLFCYHKECYGHKNVCTVLCLNYKFYLAPCLKFVCIWTPIPFPYMVSCSCLWFLCPLFLLLHAIHPLLLYLYMHQLYVNTRPSYHMWAFSKFCHKVEKHRIA